MVLVDSSVYISLLRANTDPVRELAGRFEITEIVGCDIVRCEVLRGVIRPKPKAYLAEFFDLLVHVNMDRGAWRASEELAWRLDRSGRMLPLTDIIIAVCAMRAEAAVLTHDRHFSMVPDLPLASW